MYKMHKALSVFIVLSIIATFLMAFRSWNIKTYSKEKANCEAVYFHEHGVYSVMILTEEHQLTNIYFPRSSQNLKVIILADVKDEDSLWYETDYYSSNWGRFGNITIHVRSVDDLNGSGWNHGKFGRGKTQRIGE